MNKSNLQIGFVLFVALISLKSFSNTNEIFNKNIVYFENAKDLSYKLEIKKNRLAFRENILKNSLDAPIKDLSEIKYFVDSKDFYLNINDLDKNIPKSQSVTTIPWSDDYWAVYKGGLGHRYIDSNSPGSEDWQVNFDYIKNKNIIKVLEEDNDLSRDMLSPSEKYDLIFGIVGQGLTEYFWAQGHAYYEEYNEVETWMGICHGWAAAATVIEYPNKKVSVVGMDGKNVNLYPADIKAYYSALWAAAETPHRYLGSRCRKKEAKNDENGRTIDEECFDVNPGMWHLTVLHQLGLAQKSFIIDATYDYQVWNQPMISYGFTYFNPITFERTNELTNGIVKIEDLVNDQYAKYRSPNAKYILGVTMNIEYAVESEPEPLEIETSENNFSNYASYVYDLELDENYNVIGGEWYKNHHPDFIWKIDEGTKALAIGDYQLLGESLWDGKTLMSNNWRYQAYVSAQRGQPLERFLQSLMNLMKNIETPEINEQPTNEIEL